MKEDLQKLMEWENSVESQNVSTEFEAIEESTMVKFIESKHDLLVHGQLKLMIVVEGNPVGMVDIFEYSPEFLSCGVGIFVDPARRLQQIAFTALEEVQTLLKDEYGFTQLWSNVQSNNENSLALFRKLGFTDSHSFSFEGHEIVRLEKMI